MRIYKVIIGNNFDSWLMVARSFSSAVVKANKMLSDRWNSKLDTPEEITSISFVDYLEGR